MHNNNSNCGKCLIMYVKRSHFFIIIKCEDEGVKNKPGRTPQIIAHQFANVKKVVQPVQILTFCRRKPADSFLFLSFFFPMISLFHSTLYLFSLLYLHLALSSSLSLIFCFFLCFLRFLFPFFLSIPHV